MSEIFTTPSAKSMTQDGQGGSSTTGLQGSITQGQNGAQVITATELISAYRDSHSLGSARQVQQVRTTVDNLTRIDQAAYCWGTRRLPHAELVVDYLGFDSQESVYSGRGTFFGKWDTEDEGTGTPAFGTVQTNSSVFGVSLKRSFLVSYGLAQVIDGIFHATNLGLRAIVEVYYPNNQRLARVPLVDQGPGESINAVADLTVSTSAFLQNLTEQEHAKLDNILVDLRVIIPSPGDARY